MKQTCVRLKLTRIFNLLPVMFCILPSVSNAQLPYKYDSLYKTIFIRDLCEMMKKKPDVLLVDVRSKGEYSDTSQFASLNQGHLKGAINVEIDSIVKNVQILDPYKNKTLVFYCSHSQRSRKVSKALAENGFTDFYNLNGGMSVLNQLDPVDFPCKGDFIQSNLPYHNLSFNETAAFLAKQKDLLLLDVRPASHFSSTDSVAEYNVGRIKGAINIPYDDFKNKIEQLDKNRNKTVLVYTATGDGNGARAAADLVTHGFKKVYHLLGGINNFISSQENSPNIENKTAYRLVDAFPCLQILKQKKDLLIFDSRPDDEFYNKMTGMISYKNLGHMKNAIHIEDSTYSSIQLPKNKSAFLLVYGNPGAYRFADYLITSGYKNVFVLRSFYDFVWSGFNVESCVEAKTFLEDHSGLY